MHPNGNIALFVEMELVNDAIEDLRLIQERLIRRHGDKFRALESGLDRISENPGEFSCESIGPARAAMVPSKEIRALIERARELGVI